MNALRNFGTSLRSPALVNRNYNAIVNQHPLYTKPCRGAIPWLLGIILFWNVTMFIIGLVIISLDSTYYYDDEYDYSYIYDFTWQDSGNMALTRFVWFLVWCGAPMLLTIPWVIEAVKRRRRTLSGVHIVLSGLFGAAIYGADFAGLAIFYPANGPTWVFPWFTLPAVIIYLLYMSFGCVAVDRLKKLRKKEKQILYGHEMGKMEEPIDDSLTPPTRSPSYRAASERSLTPPPTYVTAEPEKSQHFI